MQQIIHIHGGNCFPDMQAYYAYLKQKEYNPLEEKKRRGNRMKEQLPTHQYLLPQMPNSNNATYEGRKIWFEKLFPYLNDEATILIGHSQ
jgi:hypothetical protein